MVRSKAKITDDRATKAKVTDDRAAETDQTKTDIDKDGDECPPPSYPGPFSEGQKVLAYHCNRIYDAKVSKIEFWKKEWRYHVHYLGWNKDWDEWVGMDRLMIYNEENVQKQKDLDKMQGTDKNTKPGHASQIKPRNSALASSKKRKNDSVTELVKLLHEPNVDDILNKYFNDSLKNGMNVPREQEVGIGRETLLDRPQISRLTFVLRSPHQSSGTMDPNNASIDEDDGSSPLSTHTKNAKRGPTNLTIGTKGSNVDPNSAPIVEDGSSPLTANTKKPKRGPTNLTIRTNGKGTMVPNNASIGEEDGRPPLTANKKKAKRRPTNLTIGAKGTMDPNTASIGEEDGSSPITANKRKAKRGPTNLTNGAKVKGTIDPNSESIVEENESSPLVANKKRAKRGLTDLAIRAKGTMDPNSASVGEEDVSSPLVADKKKANSGPTDLTIGAKGNGTMDPSSASIGEEDGSSPLTGKRKRGKRGPTNLTIGAKGKGKEYKHELEFNQKGQPIGKSRKLTATDCGKLCRLYAPINCRTWKKVPQSVKEEMLEVIEANYECKKTTNWKARVLDKVGNRFRGFKHDMYKRFILPNLNNLEKIRDPPAGYSTITPEQWTDFVAQRTSKSWAKVRKKAQETRSKNVDAHRLSRKGYAGLEEDMDPNSASIVEEDESSPLVANKKRAKRGLTDLSIRAKGTMDPNSASVGEEDVSSPLVADKKKANSEPTDLTIGAKGNGTMDPSSASIGEEDGSSPLTGKRKGGKRGPTNLTIGAKGKGKEYKHELEFNQKGQPTGKSRKLTATDCGKLCRLYAPINCRTWKKVPQSVKEEMLEVIEANYECKKTTNWKASVLDKVGNRFRGFKHDMHKRFILPNLDNLEKIRDPPAGYSTITLEQWTDFVAQRTSKSWAEVRKKAQETQSKNVYPHRLSRKGYAGLEEELQCEGNTNEPIERHTLWKVARQKDGVYVNERVREKAEKIDELSQLVEEGSLTVEGSKDVLTQALGTQEHCGRVRGVGYLVTPTRYFQTPRPSSASFQAAMKEMMEMKKYVMTLTSEVQRLGSQVTPFCPSTSPNAEKMGSTSARGSIVGLESPQLSPSLHRPASPTTNIQKGKEKQAVVETNPSPPRPPLNKRHLEKDKGKPVVVLTDHAPPISLDDKTKPRVCRLALGSIDREVAQGYLHDVGGSSLLHGSLLGEENARVSVKSLEKAEYGSELLPIPTPDAITLVEAVGGFVSWPKHLVLLNTTMGHLKAPTKQGDFEIVVKNFAKLVDRATKPAPSAPIYVAVDQELFGSDDPLYTPASEILVFRDELMDLINFKEIGVTIMKLYMCALNKKVKELGVDHTFRFAVPAGAKGHTGNDNVDQLFDTLETAEQGQLFFYPFNIGFHWVLAIIDPLHRHTLYFDPLGNEVDGNVIDIVSYACKNLDYSFKFTSNKKKATFEKVLCPIQPGAVECGYYVLRYMKDVILSHETHPAQVFDNDECYGREMIDEVRVELMNYIRDNM